MSLTEFQKQHFERLNVVLQPEYEEKLLKITKDRQAVFDYLLSNPYFDTYTRTTYRLYWDVSAYDVDISREKFRKWYEENGEGDLEDLERYELIEWAFNTYREEGLYWQGVEGAREELISSDTFKAVRFCNRVFDWKGMFTGRSGKRFVITEIDGLSARYLDGALSNDVEDSAHVDALFGLALFKLEMSLCLTKETVARSIEDYAFAYLASRIEDEYEARGIGNWSMVDAFTYNGVQYKRIFNVLTKEESMLGTQQECEEIIRMAVTGKLKGSFGLMSAKAAEKAGN